jgi:plasmid stability protein/catechol 2,3-dioxygenase-like lactoylglutathione lyase family enzyme
MERAIPILPVDDLRAAREFYVDKLGFTPTFENSDDGYSGILGIARGSVAITLDCPMDGHGRNACVSLEVSGADRYYRECSGCVTLNRPPHDEPWGARTFDLQDPFGNTIFVMARHQPQGSARGGAPTSADACHTACLPRTFVVGRRVVSLSTAHLHRRPSGASPYTLTAAGAVPSCRATDPAEGSSPVRCLQKAPCNQYPASEGAAMATIKIRNLNDGLKHRLQMRAARHSRSMEEEVREILRRAIGEADPPLDLVAAICARIANPDRVDLQLPAREAMRDPSSRGTRATSRRAGSR